MATIVSGIVSEVLFLVAVRPQPIKWGCSSMNSLTASISLNVTNWEKTDQAAESRWNTAQAHHLSRRRRAQILVTGVLHHIYLFQTCVIAISPDGDAVAPHFCVGSACSRVFASPLGVKPSEVTLQRRLRQYPSAKPWSPAGRLGTAVVLNGAEVKTQTFSGEPKVDIHRVHL